MAALIGTMRSAESSYDGSRPVDIGAETPFERTHQDGSRIADPKKYNTHQRKGFDVPEALGCYQLCRRQKLIYGDDRQGWHVLEHADEIVAQGRNHRRNRL